MNLGDIVSGKFLISGDPIKPKRLSTCWKFYMKHYIRFIITATISLFSMLANTLWAKSTELLPKMSLYCETTSTYYSYQNNMSYLKDLPTHSKNLYSEKFKIEFFPIGKAIKKHANDIVADEEYLFTIGGTLYRLKSIKGADDFSAVINTSNGKYSSISEKHDAMVRIKSNGTCSKN